MKFSLNVFKHLILLVTVSSLLTGCCALGGLTGADTRVELDFQVWPKINPDDAGRAKPMVVRMYELKDARQFLAEDYIALIENSKDMLGGDLLNERRLQELTPGLDYQEEFVVDPGTRFIGLLGEFIQYENARTRVVFAVDEHCKTSQYIWVNSNKLDLGDEEKPDDAK